MSSRRRLRRHFTASALALLTIACSDKSPVEPDSLKNAAPASLVVSDPLPNSPAIEVAEQVVSARPSLSSAAGGEVTYVSLPPGSLPEAITVTIRNLTTGAARTPPIPILDGGFDPIAVVASAGDELELGITDVAGAIILYRVVVPKRRPPRVVRTNPPKGTIDVALNARITVVFTEPVAPATVTTATVQLLRGTTPVSGTVRPVTGSLFAVEFVPDEELGSGTTYRLVVTRGIRDGEGDSLEAEVAIDFTTTASDTASLPISPSVSIVAGWGHTCALGGDGKVLCWGGNWTGQIGPGNNYPAGGFCPADYLFFPYLCSTVPVEVVGGHTFASIASGWNHACALTTVGEALCWGNGGFGQLGSDDTTIYCYPANECTGVPVRVSGGMRFMSVAAGYVHSCGIRIGGAAYCWGYGASGQLGIGDVRTTNTGLVGSASPAAVLGGITFVSLSSGAQHVCGLDASGAAHCWGDNQEGQLGTGAASLDACQGKWDYGTTACAKAPALVDGGHSFVSLTAGLQHTCGLTPSGRAYCWGSYERWGSHDLGSYGAAPAPVNDNLAFVSLSTGASASHTCGVTSANVAYCWGRNDYGQLGDGSNRGSLAPVAVTDGLAFSVVSGGEQHSCGITVAGELYCWGDNTKGQLGVGNKSAGSLRPTRVVGQ